jgi:polyhydroxyalkanoate synthesis regulator phasin
MRKTIAAASIAVTGLGVLGLGTAAIAGAQDDPSDEADEESGGWVDDALGGLVDDGTITQEQADAVEDALRDARPERGHDGFGHPGFLFGPGGDPSTLAESLGIEEDELRSELQDGKTIAEIAEEQGVDVQDVIDDIVAAQRERLDEAVADGDLTQEEADEILAGAEERVTAFVNGERPDPENLPDLPDMRHEWRGGPWGHGPGDRDESSDDDSSEDDSSDDSSDSSEAPASYSDEGANLTA